MRARSTFRASWRILPMQLAAASCNTSSSDPTMSACARVSDLNFFIPQFHGYFISLLIIHKYGARSRCLSLSCFLSSYYSYIYIDPSFLLSTVPFNFLAHTKQQAYDACIVHSHTIFWISAEVIKSASSCTVDLFQRDHERGRPKQEKKIERE